MEKLMDTDLLILAGMFLFGAIATMILFFIIYTNRHSNGNDHNNDIG
jgi:hypothetical protein